MGVKRELRTLNYINARLFKNLYKVFVVDDVFKVYMTNSEMQISEGYC